MDNNQFNQNQAPYAPQFQAPQPPAKKPLDVFGLISMILGIVAVLLGCCCSWLSLFLGIGGVVLAIVGRTKNNGKFSGMALAGLITGAVGFLTALIVIVLPFILTMLGASSAGIGMDQMIQEIIDEFM